MSPAFDVNPFPERARELKTWITPDTGPAMSIDALVSAAPYFGVTAPRAAAIVAEVERAVATWRTTGAGLGLSDADLDAFADAFEHEERAVARDVGASK